MLLLFDNQNIEVYKCKRQSENDIEVEQESSFACYDGKVLQLLLEIPASATMVSKMLPLEGVADQFKYHSCMPEWYKG